MITLTELKNKTIEHLKLCHLDEISKDNEPLDIMWWIIENKLAEEQQVKLYYKMYYYEDEKDKNDTNKLFNLTRSQFVKETNKIKRDIKKIWEQL